jgi:MerR family redox-sensitive transcriptional activator SoxR
MFTKGFLVSSTAETSLAERPNDRRPDRRHERLAIGQVAERTGLATSAIRFYEEQGLVHSERNAAGHRRFRRSAIRRLSFILIAQKLGYRLDDIKEQLDSLPQDSAPSDTQWEELARRFGVELDERISGLQILRDKLDGCIGCGCLSLDRCALYNADDKAAERGSGPRFLLGDSADD